jgi:hypothetical protein
VAPRPGIRFFHPVIQHSWFVSFWDALRRCPVSGASGEPSVMSC